MKASRREDEYVSEISAFSKSSIKSQMEIANRRGAKLAIVIGQKESLDGTAILRDMDSGTQEIIDVKKAVHEVKKKLTSHALIVAEKEGN